MNSIWDYIGVEHQAPEAADRLMDQFYEQFRQLAIHALMGRSREEFAPKVRSFPVGDYVLFYRTLEDGVGIVRVLHGARDLENLFRQG